MDNAIRFISAVFDSKLKIAKWKILHSGANCENSVKTHF